MNKRTVILFITFFFSSLVLHAQKYIVTKQTQFSYTYFQNEDKSWGYDILSSGKLFIHQPAIPAVQGLKKFTDKESASKIAEQVIKKLKENPNDFPAVSIKELKQLRITTN